MAEKFLDAPDLSPEEKYYNSQIVSIEDVLEDEKLEIRSSKPIQVRINGGPWQDIRSIDAINRQ